MGWCLCRRWFLVRAVVVVVAVEGEGEEVVAVMVGRRTGVGPWREAEAGTGGGQRGGGPG